MTILDLSGREIKKDEWRVWKNPKTFSIEFTETELTAVVLALGHSYSELTAGIANLRGEALKDSCAAQAAILAVIARAIRLLD